MSKSNKQQFSSKMLRRMYRRYRMKRRRLERAGAREEARAHVADDRAPTSGDVEFEHDREGKDA